MLPEYMVFGYFSGAHWTHEGKTVHAMNAPDAHKKAQELYPDKEPREVGVVLRGSFYHGTYSFTKYDHRSHRRS